MHGSNDNNHININLLLYCATNYYAWLNIRGEDKGGEIRGGCGDLIARESISREASNLIPKRGKLKKKKKKSGWIVEKRGKINIRV